jgi:hypothetical protein
MAQQMDDLFDAMDSNNLILRALLDGLVKTNDTIIYEHGTVELPATQAWFTLTLAPQTTQQEIITGLFAAITYPQVDVVAPTVTIENAWAQLGGEYVNCNAILNSSGGSAGSIPGSLGFMLNSEAVRQLSITASGNFPVGLYLTFCLFGYAVPVTSGVLH